MSDIQLIKKIREMTGLSLKDIRKAVEASSSKDENKIIEELRKKGVLKHQAKSDRITNAGSVFTYNHEYRVGVIVVILSETDFVSKSPEFKEFGNDLALHIAAFEPKFVSPQEVSEEFLESEKAIIKEHLAKEDKPAEILEKIATGKIKKIKDQVSLLSQPFIKDSKITVSQKLSEIAQLTGENISIKEFKIVKLS